MPLDKSGSKASVGNNIRIEKAAGKPQAQAVAIALNTARKYRASGGSAAQEPWYIRHSAERMLRPPSMPKLATTVPAIPVGGGNLMASTPLGKALGSTPKVGSVKPSFPKLPAAPKLPKVTMKRGGEVESRDKLLKQGPLLGSTPGRADKVNAKVEDGAYVLPADCISACGQGSSLAGHAAIERMLSQLPPARPSDRQKTLQRNGKPVPVALSDGEHLLSKGSVERIGGGDYERGRELLDQFVMRVRHRQIQQLSKLPPPASGNE